MPEIEILPDSATLARRAAEQFSGLAGYAIHKRGRFVVALSGGSTPKPMNALLAAPPFGEGVDWAQVFIFWSDERCVSPDNADSNYRMARETLLSRIAIPNENIHRVHGENSSERAARVYEDELREFFRQPGGSSTPPRFDLILLGLGEDGHTASLFPGTPGIRENRRWAVAVKHEGPPAPFVDRVTFTPPVINAAANVVFLVAGANKAERLYQVLHEQYDPDRLPAQVVRPANGKLFWLLDEGAGAKIK
jgi:6-phosphogluconolactonase